MTYDGFNIALMSYWNTKISDLPVFVPYQTARAPALLNSGQPRQTLKYSI